MSYFKTEYKVIPIQRQDAAPWIMQKHYAKRMPSVTFYFGLYRNKQLLGICTFGKPGGACLSKGLMNGKFMDRIWELNRLVLLYNKKNEASFFIARCFELLPKPSIIVSFSDTTQNHYGYIYQATNWLYTGESAKRTEWVIDGMEHLHSKSIADKAKVGGKRWERLKSEYGDKLGKRERPIKHRYVYLLGSKKERKEMLKSLKYPILPYPKGTPQKYDSSAKIEIQGILFT